MWQSLAEILQGVQTYPVRALLVLEKKSRRLIQIPVPFPEGTDTESRSYRFHGSLP